MDIYDPRSLQGMFARGRNLYGGVSSTPNPVGMNQHPFNIQKAAMLRRKKQQAQQTILPPGKAIQ